MDVKQAARGRWPDILNRLNIPPECLTGRHGPCPLCDGGKDRWRFTDKDGDGMYICNQCGAGDGFALLMAYHGWTFRDAKKAVGELIDVATYTAPDRDKEKRARQSLNALRKELVHASEVPEVVEYLEGRGLSPALNLYAHPKLPYWVDGEVIAHYPAMVGRVVDVDGKPVTLHRTYIRDGKKAPVDSPRKMMTPARRAKGYAIRLYPANEVVGIAEGIETAIACFQDWRIPVWSVISANNMMEFQPPEGIKRVYVFGDNDESFTGQAVAYECARRLAREKYHVDVRIPDSVGDFNDE